MLQNLLGIGQTSTASTTTQTQPSTQQPQQQLGILQQLQQASAAAALGSQTSDIRYQSPSQSHQPNFPSVFGQPQTQQTQQQVLSKQEFQNQLILLLRNEQFMDSAYQEYLKSIQQK